MVRHRRSLALELTPTPLRRWLLVPVDSSDSSSSSSNDNVALFVKPKKSSSSASSDDFSSPSDDSEASPVIEVKAAVVPKTKTSSGKMSASSQASAAGYAPTDDDPATFDYSSVDVRDRSTWICQHPGVWLNAYVSSLPSLHRRSTVLRSHHPYVDAGHPECADVLANWRRDNLRMAKRSHSELAKVLAKRADQKFYIIAVDHLDDMVTRAIGSGTMSSPGAFLLSFVGGVGADTWCRRIHVDCPRDLEQGTSSLFFPWKRPNAFRSRTRTSNGSSPSPNRLLPRRPTLLPPLLQPLRSAPHPF